MICLGIESSAHTFSVGIVDSEGNILANVRDMYKPPTGWGIDPSKAKQHHIDVADKVISQALANAKITNNRKITAPDLISYAAGPGLPPCLRIGKEKAIKLGKKFNVPVVPVNHCIAHLEIGKLITKFKDPVMLYVSGGNTQVIAFESGYYRVFGETEDIGIGNLFDTFGRSAKIDFPAGPTIDKLAKTGKKYIELPYSVKGMDVTFSGIKTKLEKMIGKFPIEDLCYSLTETCYAMLVEISERAMAHCQKNELILTGGVAASQRLQEMCRIMCEERNAKYAPIPRELTGDQGAMIAWLGILDKKNATKNYEKLDIFPNWRTDEVKIGWM